MDACKLGFKAYVIADATKGIDLNGSLQHAWQDMLAQGVKRIYLKDIINAALSADLRRLGPFTIMQWFVYF